MKRNLLSAICALLVVVSGLAQDQKQTVKTPKNSKEKTLASNGKLTKKQVKELRKKHAYYLANNPFKKTFQMSKTERKANGLPPNKYNEQDWLLTMNPAEGRPNTENLEMIRKQLKKQREDLIAQGRVPGDGASAWIERGPNNVGGRTRAIMFDPTDASNNTVIAGGVSGGLWKNTNISSAASSWTRMNMPRNLNVTVLAADPNNNQIWYAGTGESCVGGDVNGQGLWKTTDAGATWTQVYGSGVVSTTQSFAYNLQITAENTAPIINDPLVVRGYVTGKAAFGPTTIPNILNKDIVLVNDNTDTTDDACEDLGINTAALSGKIALIRRGNCNFTLKVKEAQDAGAVAVIMMNNGPAGNGDAAAMGGTDATITIPSLMISGNDGDLLLANLTGLKGSFVVTPPGQFNGDSVTGYTFINDIVIKDMGTTSDIYMAVGDGFFNDSSVNTFFNSLNYGLYKSSNGGSNWSRLTLPVSTSGNETCPHDLELGTNGTIWVSSTDSQTFGDGGGRIFSSTDNGTTFTLKHTVTGYASGTNGTGGRGSRVEIETSSVNPNTIFVLSQIEGITANTITKKEVEIKLERTTDAFATTPIIVNLPTSTYSCAACESGGKPSREYQYGFTGQQAFYDLMIELDPTSDSILYLGGIDLYRSANAASANVTWSQISQWRTNVHSDQHALTFKPGANNVGVFGNDGGVYYSGSLSTTNTAATTRNSGFNVTQFVGVAVRPIKSGTTGDHFLAGAQDNGSNYFPSTYSTTTGATGIAGSSEVQGGDGGRPLFYQGSGTEYFVSQYVYNDNINVRSLNGATITNIAGGSKGLFYPAITLDSNNNIIYSDAVDGTIVAPGTPFQIARYSTLLTGAATIEYLNYATMMNSYATALTPGKVTPSTLYIGTMNGKLLKLTNANTVTPANSTSGTGWSDISGSSFIGSVSDVEFGANDNQIFVTMYNYGVNNVWYTPNGGTNWYRLDGNLPDLPVRAIIQNPNNTAELLIATDLGTWSVNSFNPATTADQSLSWTQSYNGMQDVRVTDLDIQKSDLSATTFNVFAATYGRGVFSGPLTSVLSVNQNDLISKSISVYPTISKGAVTISSDKIYGKTKLELFDITGKKVSNSMIDLNGNESKVDFGTLSSGNYILKISGEEFVTTKRLVIE